MCLQYPVQLFLVWSVVVKLRNNGILLHLQKSFDINYFTIFTILWLASVPCKYLGNFLDGTAFRFRDRGWALSPYKNLLNLDYCSFLLANLRLGVHGFDGFLWSSW